MEITTKWHIQTHVIKNSKDALKPVIEAFKMKDIAEQTSNAPRLHIS